MAPDCSRVRHRTDGGTQDVIDHVDQRLQDWIGRLACPAAVRLAGPGEMGGQSGVSLHLLEVVGNPPARGVQRPPLALTLRYLITVWLAEVQGAHRLLGELVFAAMEENEFEVEPEPLPLAAWAALGVAPRPALVLRVPLRKPRPEARGPRVRGRMSVRFGALRPLRGRVVGPGGVPIMAAAVSLPALGMTVRTDHQGRFHFAAVPEDPPIRQVQVNARGLDVMLPIPAGAREDVLLFELNETQI